MKKILSVIICLCLLLGSLPMSVFAATGIKAATEEVFSAEGEAKLYKTLGSVNDLKQLVNLDAFRTTLFNGIYNCQETIDISSYGIDKSYIQSVAEFLYDEMAETFHLNNSYNYSWNSSNVLTRLSLTYNCTASEYQTKYAEFVAAANAMVVDIKDNAALTDVYYNGTAAQKAKIVINSSNSKLINATWHCNG